MHALLRDLRYSLRSLAKSPGSTLVAILALTLGIGLTTTMFSIVYSAMMRGLPYPDGDRIMAVSRSNPSRNIERSSLPLQEFFDYKRQQRTFTDLGAYTSGTMYVSGREKAEGFGGSWITANLFDLVQVRPVLGRTFRAGEDTPAGEKVVILAYTTWQQRYGGAQDIVGRVIRVNGLPFTVVGVMPEGFAFPQEDQLWIPLQTDPLATKRGQGQFVSVVGRLKPGVSADQASVDLATIGKRLAAAYPETNEGFVGVTTTFIDAYLGKEPRQLLYTMLGAVFCVLLIACANVANLLLDRAAHRTKEVGIRTALGATRFAVVRQFLAESLVLSAVAAVLGIGVAHVGIALFLQAVPPTNIPFFIDIRLHPAVLLFTVALALATTLFAGVIPAYQSSRTDINEVLKDETRGASSLHVGRMSKGLVMLEVALSCGLLVAAGLMIKSVTKIRTMDKGFTSSNVFTARLGFPAAYTDTATEWRFFDQVVERVAALPGVVSASISSGLPGARTGFSYNPFALEGQTYAKDQDYPNANTLSVTPRFFETLKIPLVTGRAFTDADRADAVPVVVVNRTFVDRFFKNTNPIGRRVRLGGARSTAPWATIVGVTGDVFTGEPDRPVAPAIFQPFAQARAQFVYIAARTAGAPMAAAPAVRDAVAALNPDIPLYWVASYDAAIAQSLWFVRVFGSMFMIFGFVALFLASVGLYAVISFSVSRRTREVGIRMALGAQTRDVVRMIFGQGLVQLTVGMAVGLTMALGISRLLSVILYDVQPRDPVIFGGVVVVLLGVGLLACVLPARRATRVDPLVALRSE